MNSHTKERTRRNCAVAYHQDPSCWRIITETYGQPSARGNRPVVITPPALDAAPLTPAFLCTWQIALVAPRTEVVDFMSRRTYEWMS